MNEKGKPEARDHEKGQEPPRDAVLTRFWSVIDRFGLDFLAILLFCLFILSILGLLQWTNGTFIERWIHLLRDLVGWGSYYAVFLFGLLGLLALRKHFIRLPLISFKRILSLEGLIFSTVVILDLVGGHNLAEANNGNWGGTIGWGLVEILPPPFRIITWIFAILLTILFILHGFGIIKWLVLKIEKWLGIQHEETKSNNPTVFRTPDKSELGVSQDGKVLEIEKTEAAIALHRDERLPPLNLLSNDTSRPLDEETIQATAQQIESTLAEFGIPAKVVGYRTGPTVTQYAVEPGFIDKENSEGEATKQKIRVAQISALSKDLTLALSAERIRIEAPVPGRAYIGIEIPNSTNAMVRLRPVLESENFQKLSSPLGVALGKDVSGQPVVADLSKMPHLLIAGTTGSGKSVCITTLITCLIMNNTPADLRLVMLDPKMVELVRFNGLPHLMGAVETNQDRMQAALQWAIAEMDNRYRILEDAHVRDLESYNRRMQRKKQPTLPRIVILIDELADLMMARPEQTQFSLVRLAQMARATGIHLVVATQRPSTNVITGIIKANFPARIAFMVASGVDSRVILDMTGAETLLGKGDLLFLNPEVGNLQRAQGIMVTDAEIKKIINFWQRMSPVGGEVKAPWEDLVKNETESEEDGLLEQAIDVVRKSRHASASLLQRRLRLGYPRAARLIDELEEMGVVGPAQVGGKEREVLIPEEGEATEDRAEDHAPEDYDQP
jgi:S-DNA-T family DNA segregation ATPase FtsK/SpoIIIE